jgi:hypothetical protein
MVTTNTLDIRFLSSRDQLADIFTKQMSTARLALLHSKNNVMASPLTLRGRVNDIPRLDSNEDQARDKDKDLRHR